MCVPLGFRLVQAYQLRTHQPDLVVQPLLERARAETEGLDSLLEDLQVSVGMCAQEPILASFACILLAAQNGRQSARGHIEPA